MNMLLRAEILLLSAALAGCSLAPTYQVPKMDLPEVFHETGWVQAKPVASAAAKWWEVYDDAILNDLQGQLSANNQRIKEALAHYQAAAASAAAIEGKKAPQVDAGGAFLRQRQSDNRPLRGASQPSVYDSYTSGIDALFDLDVWGRLRNLAEMENARAEAAGDDYLALCQAMEAKLTVLYLQLRGQDKQIFILRQSISSYEEVLKLTRSRYEGKIASELDMVRAQHQLADARSQLDESQGIRVLIQHAIAELLGKPAGELALSPHEDSLKLPAFRTFVPSSLLQQRPDIAAAERRVYAANAAIGVARAAQYPDISLSASVGGQSMGSGSLLSTGNRYWALGPLIHLPIFEGGKLEAEEKRAFAELDEASAQYKGTVLRAIRQVEDGLARLNHLAKQSDDETDAVIAAHRATSLAQSRYREGAASYLDVIAAQTAYLQAQKKLQEIDTLQLTASAQLLAAIAGKW